MTSAQWRIVYCEKKCIWAGRPVVSKTRTFKNEIVIFSFLRLRTWRSSEPVIVIVVIAFGLSDIVAIPTRLRRRTVAASGNTSARMGRRPYGRSCEQLENGSVPPLSRRYDIVVRYRALSGDATAVTTERTVMFIMTWGRAAAAGGESSSSVVKSRPRQRNCRTRFISRRHVATRARTHTTATAYARFRYRALFLCLDSVFRSTTVAGACPSVIIFLSPFF